MEVLGEVEASAGLDGQGDLQAIAHASLGQDRLAAGFHLGLAILTQLEVSVELTVPSGAANGNFENVTATISYGVLENATLTLGNGSDAKTLYIAKGAEVTFTATGLDSIQIDYTAPGAKEPEVTTEKAAEDEVTISFQDEGSYNQRYRQARWRSCRPCPRAWLRRKRSYQ